VSVGPIQEEIVLVSFHELDLLHIEFDSRDFVFFLEFFLFLFSWLKLRFGFLLFVS
jgi:hypothetical protein